MTPTEAEALAAEIDAVDPDAHPSVGDNGVIVARLVVTVHDREEWIEAMDAAGLGNVVEAKGEQRKERKS